MLTAILFLWLPLCIAVGLFAHTRRNRFGFGWFLFALFLSPLLGFIFVAILEPLSPIVEPIPTRQPQPCSDDLRAPRPWGGSRAPTTSTLSSLAPLGIAVTVVITIIVIAQLL
jgi:hypothetical protein